MKSINDVFLSFLEKTLGTANVVSDARMLDALAAGSFRPAALCRPGGAEEAAAVVRLAAEHKVPLVPCGGWTAQAFGEAAPAGALAVSLQRLDKLVEYNPDDLVATAQAGMSFGALQAALAERGQCLPLDAPEHATLGGLVATDRHGPRRLLYGSLRDMLLGLAVVNGDGVPRRCGGRVVKNVTGYALEKLYIGSLGTLGLLTEVTFKLRPLPETAGVQELTAPNFELGFGVVRELAMRLPFAAVTASFPGKPFSAQLGLEAAPPDHARMLREIEAAVLLTGQGLEFSGAAQTRADADEYPARPRRLRAVQLNNGQEVVPELLARLTWPCRAGDFAGRMAKVDVAAQEAGFGALMAFFDFPGQVSLELFAEHGVAQGVPGNLDRLVRSLRGEGCAATVAWKSAAQPLTEKVFGPPRPEWKLMREIKRQFDPAGILNPGRFGPF